MRIRLANAADIPQLDAIEQSAAKAFIGSSVGYIESRSIDPTFLTKLCERRTLWVADDGGKPVGFIACYPLDGFFYVHETAVSREYQGKGLGRQMMHVIENYALDQNLPYIGLTTYRDIRWNGPFYKSLGFKEIAPDLYSGLHNKYKDDLRRGIKPEALCVMIKVLED